MADDYGDIMHRMLRDLEEFDARPSSAPRCDGCGRRVELAPYQRRTTDSRAETLHYCAGCRAEAMIALVEDGGP